MNLLVTGGAGFIGSNFLHYMSAKYPAYRFVNLDKLTYAGNLDNLKNIEDKPNYFFVRGDIGDENLVAQLMEEHKIDAVVNFAAESHVDRSIEDPSSFIKTNCLGTQILLHQAKKHQISRYLQISTDEVYGSLGPTGYFTEETPLDPSSPYAASKTAGDLLVMAYFKTHKFPCLITRCSNNYGPYQFPEKLIPLMITNAVADIPLPVYGDGLNVRDWIYVEDHCQAIDLVLHKGKEGQVYNIGGNSEKPNIEIVRSIIKEVGKNESLINFVKDRLGHDRRYAMDISKIKRELGWQPAWDFGKGLKQTIKWYLENKEWWQKIKTGEYLDYYERQYVKR